LNLQQDWPIDSAFVSKVKKAGLKMLVWTVDDPDKARKFVDAVWTR
jgi:glycerophosphoryl diester phosphodiesterase